MKKSNPVTLAEVSIDARTVLGCERDMYRARDELTNRAESYLRKARSQYPDCADKFTVNTNGSECGDTVTSYADVILPLDLATEYYKEIEPIAEDVFHKWLGCTGSYYVHEPNCLK